jgi:hypothetical protein
MRTVQLKYDIISWVTGINDKKTILKLHHWMKEQELVFADKTDEGIVPPRRKGCLTEGFGFWGDDAVFDETNYRDKLWQAERNIW